jgi:PAS domain S-box-containing protein
MWPMESMAAAGQLSMLVELAGSAKRSPDVDEFLAVAVPRLCLGTGAVAGAVLDVRSHQRHSHGVPLPPAQPELGEESDRAVGPAPPEWASAGVEQAMFVRLPGHLGVLALGWDTFLDARESDPVLEAATDTVVATLARHHAESELADLVARVASAQQLASMGDYDWHIASDTNRWSDQLYRIYGFEPQTFNASYERFLARIHPDDRERIQAIHQTAYATGEPYNMIERIVRPDGEVRYLSSNGQVIMGPAGTPERMRGTCVDITERILAEQATEKVSLRFRGLVDASPQAILVVSSTGEIVQANPRATELLDADPTGHDLVEIGVDLEKVGLGVPATSLTGRELVLDISAADLGETEDTHHHALFLADATKRLEREAMAQRLGEAQQRRRQALEINDNVVQGLTAAMFALEADPSPVAHGFVERTLAAARRMMDGLVEPTGPHLVPGDLVRAGAASLGPTEGESPEPSADARPGVAAPDALPRVLIVDDAEDIRMLLRLQLDRTGSYEVVGEAADGLEAVSQATELQPDLVLLDMAMPRMDGLEALPLIRAAVPGVRVIVFSGFGRDTLEQDAIAAGADRYLLKGIPSRELLEVIATVLEAA